MKKVVDCFIFYNELDLLNYRLNVLDDFIDYFIIVESTHTFVGKEKILYFNENKALFEQFKEKIIHIIVDDMPYKLPGKAWDNEYHQRNCISRGIEKLKLNNDDLIIISDLDEIPDPSILFKLKNDNIELSIKKLRMDMYYYNLNTKYDIVWDAVKIFSYKFYIDSKLSCQEIRNYNCPIITNGGWHLSYFGDSNFIKNKIEMFSHQELNIPTFTSTDKIEYRVKNGTDIFDRNCYKITRLHTKDNTYLPPKYSTFLTKYICL